MKVLTVIPISKKVYKEELTYFSGSDVPAGAIVSAPIRGKEIDTLVMGSEDLADSKMSIKSSDFSLRKINKIKGHSFFLPEFLSATIEAKKYFASPASLVFYSLVPNIFLERYNDLIKNSAKNINATVFSKNIKCEKTVYQALIEERLSFYKIFIRNAISKKESVFILTPTILQTEFLSESLKKGIESHIYTMHGNISDKKIIEIYNNILSDPLPVIIIATGSYLFIPRIDIKSIIVEDEGSSAYKSLSRPFLDFRTFAEILATEGGKKIIFGGSLLRLETIDRKNSGELEEISPMSFRLSKYPERKIVEQKENSVFRPISKITEIAIRKEIENKNNVFIFVSRKGLATTTACRDCGEIVLCSKCSHTLVLYKKAGENIFKCNKCKNIEDSNKVCLKCNGWNLSSFGIGTEMIADYIMEIFGKEKVFRIDSETPKISKVIEEFESKKGVILIGTNLALSEIRQKVSLSIIPSLDSMLSIPNFRINEKIMRILFLIFEKTEKNILIQSKDQDEEFLKGFVSGKITEWVKSEFKDRKIASYPPFSSIIKVSFLGKINDIIKNKTQLSELFLIYNPEFMQVIRQSKTGLCLCSMIIKAPKMNWISNRINAKGKIKEDLSSRLTSLPPLFSVDIDPDNTI